LLPHLVDRASDIVLARQKDGTNYGDLMQCAHCDRVGNLCDVRYYEHFVGSHHHVCVRLQSPVELYCCICGDFQYSHSFDGKVNRKRQRSAPASAYSLLVPPPRKPSAASPSKSSASLPASYPSSSASAPLRTTGSSSSSSSSSSSANDSASQLSAEDEAVATALLGGMQRVLMRRGNASSGGSSDMTATRSPRGICNMGSTCFMGSVLQVMLNNPLLQARREMQMTFSEPYNKGCSKAAHAVAASQVSSSSSSSSETSSSSSSSSSAGLLSCISDGCIACELRCLFGEAADDPSHHPASIIPSNLLYSVWIFAEYMAGYDQQDAHEFLIALLDGLAQHLERYHKQEPPSSSAVKTANGAGAGAGGGVVDLTCSSDSASNGSSSSSTNGMVSQVFLGVLHSRVVCMSCGNSSSKQDPILDVSLSLESVGWGNAEAGIDLTGASKDPFAPISLRDCLRFFTSKETLSERVACGRCNQHCPAQKSLSFAVAPHTLVLHLKRFDAINQRKVSLPRRSFLPPSPSSPLLTHSLTLRARTDSHQGLVRPRGLRPDRVYAERRPLHACRG